MAHCLLVTGTHLVVCRHEALVSLVTQALERWALLLLGIVKFHQMLVSFNASRGYAFNDTVEPIDIRDFTQYRVFSDNFLHEARDAATTDHSLDITTNRIVTHRGRFNLRPQDKAIPGVHKPGI